MPLTIQVFIPNGETEATLTAITGTGTAANPYAITQQGTSQFGTIEVADAIDPADNLLGLWQWKVGTRAIGRVLIVEGQTDYPIQSNQQAAAAAITAAGLALEATLDDIKGATFDTATDSLEAIRNRGDAAWVTGGGGGDATEAKQDEILAAVQGAQVIQVPSPSVLGNLVLTQGDTYDGVGNPKAQWNVTTDYTDGLAVALTIRGKNDVVVYTNAGTVDSATVVSVPIATPTVSPMVGCPGSWEGKFDVELSKGTAPNRSVKTIALGKVFINEDQTR
jgi:hypothetical protein